MNQVRHWTTYGVVMEMDKMPGRCCTEIWKYSENASAERALCDYEVGEGMRTGKINSRDCRKMIDSYL